LSSLRPAPISDSDAGLELGSRFAAVQVGYWLGWASILVVLAGLALDVGAKHRWRPDGAEGTRFDETAARIRSIATVHRLLTEAVDCVDGAALLRSITQDAPVPAEVVFPA
jgi:hypothetical protein